MALIRLNLHEHPAPPFHEIRQKSVLDSRGSFVGTVAHLYVDEDGRQLHFVDVVTSAFLGLGRKHHLIPVEAGSEEDPGSITLAVEQETVEKAPAFPDPPVGPDEEYQRTIRDHYGCQEEFDLRRNSDDLDGRLARYHFFRGFRQEVSGIMYRCMRAQSPTSAIVEWLRLGPVSRYQALTGMLHFCNLKARCSV